MKNKIEELKSEIAEMEEVYKDSSTPDDIKKALKPAIDKAKELLVTELENKTGTKFSKNEPVIKNEKKVTDSLENCRQLLNSYRKKKDNDSERIEKRLKSGKPAILTPSETVKSTAKKVKDKVQDIQEKTDKGLGKGEIDKLSTGILSTIIATLEGIISTSEKHKFLVKIIKEVNVLNKNLPKLAEDGMKINSEKMIAEGNSDMVESNIHSIKHHAEEIENSLGSGVEVEAWVVAKAERAATDLSDITHYLDGLKAEKHFGKGGMADSGTFDEGVKAIEKKLEGTKVNPKYQKDYGKTYNKKEAHEAATNIKGAMRTKYGI